MTKALYKFDNISGINNVDPANRLPYKRDPATYAVVNDVADVVNMDIDNTHTLVARPGYSLEVSGSLMHSLWSDNETCLFVDGTRLYQLNEDYSITELFSGLEYGARMVYENFKNRIYMTNGSMIGCLNNQVVTELTNPGITYKNALPAGRFLVAFLARLYVALRNVLYIADALCDHYDVRSGYKVFPKDITMLRPVGNGGMFISAGKTWFIDQGEELSLHPVSDNDAIPYTDIVVSGEDIGDAGVQGKVAIWTSSTGICMGDAKGNVKNITKDKFVIGTHGRGAAVQRGIDGVEHYITVLE